ncbi:probable F-box protein At1g60180 [Beta vulgaris subsp. vulgaris]|uniref:probable F-box protein At1g60180 n=1 Tax=Beta vulgaris subsp. vulgaris TaxID=3555 RepID=UPI00053F70C0|nr:probable F-box protein At1g60180 [Beta vulgaris subsp. vulgaris]
MASSTSKAIVKDFQRWHLQPSTCDQFSKLPDSIIIHILSFLPTFDAMYCAGFVSKRFASLKLSLPSLVFLDKAIPSCQGHNLCRYINDILVFQDHDNLRRCCFHLYYNGYCPNDHDLDTWIKLTLHRKKVRELEILFVRSSSDCRFYCLPRFLFKNEILTSLSLSRVGFNNVVKEMHIHWKSLKSLSMTHITDLDDDMLAKILVGCPILEFLELKSCRGIKKVDIVSKSLKELVIYDCVYSNNRNQRGKILRVSAPSLRVLVISGSNRFNKCTFENLSSLVEATMFFESFWHDGEFYDSYGDDDNGEDSYEYDNVINFFGSVQHVKKLTLLGTWNLHVQSTKPWAYSFSNCKSLTLDINLKKWELPALAIMLQSCPELESLTMDMTTPQWDKMDCECHKFDFEGKNFWQSDPSYVNSSLLGHLKTVKIVGAEPLRGGELVVEFMQFILKHAKVLERLSICIDEKAGAEHEEESLFQLSIFHMLLSFPRSSILAVIEVISSQLDKRLSSSC